MINATNIPEGAVVYVCRRKLAGRYVGQMEIETRKVVKRTPTGYKLEDVTPRFSYGVRLYKDSDYYVGTDQKEVALAVKDDAQVALAKLRDRETRLVNKVIEMDRIVNG